jgi:enamine deaminase RidA (YjgF/YER057c/UK114 family)
MSARILQPDGWARPSGYSNGMAARGTQVFIAGQIGWLPDGRFPSSDLADQVRLALENILAVLKEARGEPRHIVRLTWFVTSRTEYTEQLAKIGAAYRSVMGKHFPAMSVVQVAGLIEAQAKVEIEATAVIPDGA